MSITNTLTKETEFEEVDIAVASNDFSIAPKEWVQVCAASALIADAGICALIKDQQIAIFYLPSLQGKIFAVSNYDPISKANVIYRGIVGSVNNAPVIASPMYKQQFWLETGGCIQQEDVALTTFPVKLENGLLEVFC